MSKTLSNILTVFKVVKIISKVVFILCIVGGAGCLIGLTALPMMEALLPMDLLAEEGLDLPTTYLSCIVGLIVCVGEAIFAFLAERYFGHVLEAGTPFTLAGAKECFRLGIASLIIEVATSVAAGVAAGILLLFSQNLTEIDADASISLSAGLLFLFLSLIFRYGSELNRPAVEEKTEETTES